MEDWKKVLDEIKVATEELDKAKTLDDEGKAIEKLNRLSYAVVGWMDSIDSKYYPMLSILIVATQNVSIYNESKYEDGWNIYLEVAKYYFEYVYEE